MSQAILNSPVATLPLHFGCPTRSGVSYAAFPLRPLSLSGKIMLLNNKKRINHVTDMAKHEGHADFPAVAKADQISVNDLGSWDPNSQFGSGYSFSERDMESEENLWKLYERWVQYMKDEVDRSPEEMRLRFETFKNHVKVIHAEVTEGKKDHGWLKLDVFADMSDEEFRAKYVVDTSGWTHGMLLDDANQIVLSGGPISII